MFIAVDEFVGEGHSQDVSKIVVNRTWEVVDCGDNYTGSQVKNHE